MENIPRKMTINERVVAEVRLGKSQAAKLVQGFVGSGLVAEHDVAIVDAMSVQLVALGGDFDIHTTSPQEQLVRRDMLEGTEFARFGTQEFGQWIFFVTPKTKGAHKLALRISANVNGHGHATLPDRVIPIDVVVSYSKWSAELAWRMAKLAGTGSVTGLFGALVGGFTGKYWWPPVEAWMKARGWM